MPTGRDNARVADEFFTLRSSLFTYEHDRETTEKCCRCLCNIVIRLAVSECRVMGRATQGVRLINLAKKNDVIASVCKVMSSELEASVEEESKAAWAKKSEEIEGETASAEGEETPDTEETPNIDFE